MATEIRIIGISGIPLLKQGDNLAKMILDAAERQGTPIEEGDVLVITQKVVSKVEGRVYKLSQIQPSSLTKRLAKRMNKDPALVELVLRESKAIVRMFGKHIITETRHGWVCANSGVDVSNVSGGDSAALLPIDPDRSARELQKQVRILSGKNVAVIISDTFGRPFRVGHVDVAIGCSGIAPILNLRGVKDLFGYELKVKETAIVDELASAAELVIGNAGEGIPAAIVRGYRYPISEEGSRRLVMRRRNDLFR
ncbi:MAG: coenzyme F420-0:L-glutamate ligase [Candidatus Bathyarchaeia archaeon]